MSQLGRSLRAPAACAVVAALLAAGCGGGPTSPDPGGPVAFTLISNVSAPVGLFPNAAQQVVRDQTAWTNLWAQLNGGASPPPALPAVNFSTEMLIVAAMGTRGSGGYSIAVTSIGESGGIMTVNLTDTSPGPTCGVADFITSPVTIVAVPASSDTVTFVTTNQTHNC